MIYNLPRAAKEKARVGAFLAPDPNATYTSGLTGLEASDVTAIANLISDCADVTNETMAVYVDNGDIHRKISVGDQVTLPLDGTNYAFDIIGFNHDPLYRPTAYGVATKTGKAGMTLEMHDLFGTAYPMNSTNSASGGWLSSQMRSQTMPQCKDKLPTDWQQIIKQVNKEYTRASSSGINIATTYAQCFLVSGAEVFGVSTLVTQGEGIQYPYYKDDAAKDKMLNGVSTQRWTRSVRMSSGFGDARFLKIYGWGGTALADANVNGYMAFAFCV